MQETFTFSRERTAHLIADWITLEAMVNTDNGSWCVYFDEIKSNLGIDISEDIEMQQMISDATVPDIVENVEICTDDGEGYFDINMWLRFCVNFDPDTDDAVTWGT